MVIISDSRVNGVPSVWAEDYTCKSDSSSKCKMSSPKKIREYVVRVTATDESGKFDMVQCNTIVGGNATDVVANDPLFLITKVDIIGGVESHLTPPWGTKSPTLSPTESSLPSLRPYAFPSSTPSSSSIPSSSSRPTECTKEGEPAPGGCDNRENSQCCSGVCSDKGDQPLCK